MITPPQSTQSFYTAVFNKSAAEEVIRAISPAHANDVVQLLVTSLDIQSDMQAIDECQTMMNHIAAQIGQTTANIKFNPMYLPTEMNMDKLELDANGDIIKIDGFNNPYVTATLTCGASPDEASLIEANVCFKPFEIPSVAELLRPKKVLLS